MAALAAASLVYWGLKLSGSSTLVSAPPAQSAMPAPAADATAVARALGGGMQMAANSPVVNASPRYVLTGIVADRQHAGAALISVDGKPTKPFRVGARVDDSLVLQSVAQRAATLGSSADAPASVTLELAPRKP
jgi:general secretion pathway protein C